MKGYRSLVTKFPLGKGLEERAKAGNKDPRLGRGFVYQLDLRVIRRIPSPFMGTTAQRRARSRTESTLSYVGLTRFSIFKRLEEHASLGRSLGTTDPRSYRGYDSDRYEKEYPKKSGAGPLHIAMRMAIGTTETNFGNYDKWLEDIHQLAEPSLFALPTVEADIIHRRGLAPESKNNYYWSIIKNNTGSLNRKSESGYGGVAWSQVTKHDIFKAAHIYLTEEARWSHVESFLNARGENGQELQATRLLAAFYMVNDSFLNKNTRQLEKIKKELIIRAGEIAAFEEYYEYIVTNKEETFKSGAARRALQYYFNTIKNPKKDHTIAIKQAFEDLGLQIADVSLYSFLTGQKQKFFKKNNIRERVREDLKKIVVETENEMVMSLDSFFNKVVEDVNKSSRKRLKNLDIETKIE